MNTAMFLKLDGIPGDSRNARHLGSIEISGFTWGNDHTQPRIGSGAGPGKASINDLTVFKPGDRTTPVLRVTSAEGRYIPHGALTVEFSNVGSLVRTVIWKMESILIDSVTSSGHGPTLGGKVTEAVGLNFANYKIVHF